MNWPALLFGCWMGLAPAESPVEMELPGGLERHYQFWVQVFTGFSIHEQLIVDSRAPYRIYRVADYREAFPGGHASRVRKNEWLAVQKKEVAELLRSLSMKSEEDSLTHEESAVLACFGSEAAPSVIRDAVRYLRVQGGMREPFLEGLVLSGRYLDAYRKIFRDRGLPERLIYLPHVESGYRFQALSRDGAAGVWQFTRGAARPYLRMDRDVDERLDPMISARAAARVLAGHYRSLGSWPLAVTAYNTGLSGIRRVMKGTGSADLGDLVRQSSHGRFGFASKNFYVAFLAAASVAENPEPFFGPVRMEPPWNVAELTLRRRQNVESLVGRYGVPGDTLKALNPALLPGVWNHGGVIPAGVILRLPFETVAAAGWEEMEAENGSGSRIISVPSELTLDLGVQDETVVVQAGETLGHYAQWLEIPSQELRRINGMLLDSGIQAGQQLKVIFQIVDEPAFQARRQAFHHERHVSFFQDYVITDTREVVLKAGESFWTLARQNGIPFWLLLAWNNSGNTHRLVRGQRVKVPVIKRNETESGSAGVSNGP